jgi:putative mRNA 3-end processing factor
LSTGGLLVSGDYKRQPDRTCAAFEPIGCDVFVSEATFALPVYRWPPTGQVIEEIARWWRINRDRGIASVLFCYALGKAQRILAELAELAAEPVHLHGAMLRLTQIYRDAGVPLLPTLPATLESRQDYRGALILAPPSAAGSSWMRRFGEHSSAFCSGWMRVRAERRRRGYDRGFVLSDHADWPALLQTCRQSGARRVLLTHGQADALTRFLREQGFESGAVATPFGGAD